MPFGDKKMMNLFDISYKKIINLSDDIFYILNPLGNIVLEIFFNESSLSEIPPNVIGEISKSSYIYIWDVKNFHIELLKINLAPSLPLGMKVDHCIAFLGRFKSKSGKMHLKLNCRLLFKGKKLEGGPEPGEGLVAYSWEDNNSKITIGTEDEEYLLARAEQRQTLPFRLATEQLIVPELIEYLEDGIQISLPYFLENEMGQIQFIVSWIEKNKKKNDVSTWFAVDISPEEILKNVKATMA